LEDVFSMQSIEKLYSLLPTVPLLLKAGVAWISELWDIKIWPPSPAGFGTKNDCAAEGQQQFIQLTKWPLCWSEGVAWLPEL
jgi:hypothetical protein